MIFNDSRLCLEPEAVFNFVNAIENAKAINEGGCDKVWFNGKKGSSTKVAFVENFSAVKREHIVSAGMFCERIQKYGGMTQEVRTRWVKQGGKFSYLDMARAKEIKSSKHPPEVMNQIKESKLLLYKLYDSERH